MTAAMVTAPTMPSQPLSGKGFYAFAPEVRGMIFEKVLSGTWYGETHELIHALRGSKLYLEALDVFARTNKYRLHEGNGWSFEDMSLAAVNTIRNLEIEFVGGAEARPIRHMFRAKHVLMLKHVRSLTLKTSRIDLLLSNFAMREAHLRLSEIVLKTCSIIAYGIYYSNASYNRLTQLTVFTAGAPAPFDDIQEVEDQDWTFELLGRGIIDLFNNEVEGNPNKAVLAWVSSSDTQEWLWQCGKGVFVLDSTGGADISRSHTNSDGHLASDDSDYLDDSGDSESEEDGSASGSDNSDLDDEEEDDLF